MSARRKEQPSHGETQREPTRSEVTTAGDALDVAMESARRIPGIAAVRLASDLVGATAAEVTTGGAAWSDAPAVAAVTRCLAAVGVGVGGVMGTL